MKVNVDSAGNGKKGRPIPIPTSSHLSASATCSSCDIRCGHGWPTFPLSGFLFSDFSQLIGFNAIVAKTKQELPPCRDGDKCLLPSSSKGTLPECTGEFFPILAQCGNDMFPN